MKNKAGELGGGAAKEFNKASQMAQQKTGGIELYSGKYYASCIFGGMLACVSITKLFCFVSMFQCSSLLRLHTSLGEIYQ